MAIKILLFNYEKSKVNIILLCKKKKNIIILKKGKTVSGKKKSIQNVTYFASCSLVVLKKKLPCTRVMSRKQK